jgi:hypothetical protein
MAVAGLALLLGGCALSRDDKPLTLEFTAEPAGTHCELIRAANNIGGVDTPGKVQVTPNRHDIVAVCTRPGYRDGLFVIKSEAASLSAADFILPMGGTMKSISGSRNSYQASVAVVLEPLDARE